MLVSMLFYTNRKHYLGENGERRHFSWMLILNILILLSDNGIYLMRGHGGSVFIVANNFFCMAYFVMHAFFCYAWMRYVLVRLYPRHVYTIKEKAVMYIPAAINCVITFATPFTGWVYTISEENVYHRGYLVTASFATASVYWAVSTVLLLREYRNTRRNRKSGELKTLLLAPLPILAGNVLQLCFYGLSIVWVSSALSMLILFIDVQNEQLTHDKMTGLYNRGQANAQFFWEVEHLQDSSDLLFAIMLDVDKFKSINDCYGHLAGDRTLIRVAGILQNNCRKSDFVSRFGGDEFLILGHVKNTEDAAGITKRIEKALSEENKLNVFPCPISLSYGIAVCTPQEEVTVDSILAEADQNMYEMKKNSHIGSFEKEVAFQNAGKTL